MLVDFYYANFAVLPRQKKNDQYISSGVVTAEPLDFGPISKAIHKNCMVT